LTLEFGFGGYGEEIFMDTRIFNRTITVRSTDGQRTTTFGRGERVRNIRRIGKGFMFEPVDPRHIAGTYTMEAGEFEANTSAVREARA
jgi:hypothetical protein